MENEFKIEGYEYNFRIKKMNAIEVLALQTVLKMDNVDSAVDSFSTMLEYIEVDCAGKWLPVKMKKAEVYYPAEIETNYDLVKQLCSYFINDYLRPVFRKSNESKK